jgi:hypothetical protein
MTWMILVCLPLGVLIGLARADRRERDYARIKDDAVAEALETLEQQNRKRKRK